MTRSKRHHFVAKSVLERFKSSKGKLWHFRPETGRGVEQRNTDSILLIRNDNTFKAGANSHDQLEKAYARLDDDWKKYTDQMIDLVANGVLPQFDNSSKDAFFESLHRQFWRSPDSIHDRDNSTIVKEAKEEIEQRFGSFSQKVDINDEFIANLEHNAIVAARNRTIEPDILSFYSSFEISFLRISSLIEPFIIGSAIRSASHGMVVVPLSRKVAIALRSKSLSGPEIIKVTRKNAGIVRAANLAMAKTSRWGIAGGDGRQITALARHCPVIESQS